METARCRRGRPRSFREQAGTVTEVSADAIDVANEDGTTQTIGSASSRRSNQGTLQPASAVAEGEKIAAGKSLLTVLHRRDMALGANLLVAFASWEGHNYEDAIILSQRLVQDDVPSSIHIEEHEVDARDTKLGPEEITRDIPNVSEEVLR